MGFRMQQGLLEEHHSSANNITTIDMPRGTQKERKKDMPRTPTLPGFHVAAVSWQNLNLCFNECELMPLRRISPTVYVHERIDNVW